MATEGKFTAIAGDRSATRPQSLKAALGIGTVDIVLTKSGPPDAPVAGLVVLSAIPLRVISRRAIES